MAFDVAVLAAGPWAPDDVTATWSANPYDPSPELAARAARAVAERRARGATISDGTAARLVSFRATAHRLQLELQSTRWALTIVDDPAVRALSVLCLVRDAHGRWLAGRRAGWTATWPGRWTLGAAGAIEAGEQPSVAMRRELGEEWGVQPRELLARALIHRSPGRVFLLGLAELGAVADITPDAEHDAFAWWPSDPAQWPTTAHPDLRHFARICLAGGPSPAHHYPL